MVSQRLNKPTLKSGNLHSEIFSLLVQSLSVPSWAITDLLSKNHLKNHKFYLNAFFADEPSFIVFNNNYKLYYLVGMGRNHHHWSTIKDLKYYWRSKVCHWILGFPFFRKKMSILEMEWSGSLLRKPEFRDISGSNGNWNVYGLSDVNRKFFRFTEWKP